MSRKKIVRPIPSLPKKIFQERDHKSECLLSHLRAIARPMQQAESQPFYTIREIATKYSVPLSMVVRAYRELEREGILRRIRSSGTLLQGLNSSRTPAVRGVIVIASSLFLFLALQDYRSFLTHIRRQLRRREFSASEVFFDASETADELARQIGRCGPDKVIWYSPDRLSNEPVLRLADMGIGTIGINDSGSARLRCPYEIDRRQAIFEIASVWKKAGVTKVNVGISLAGSKVHEESIDFVLQGLDFDVQLVTLGFEKIDRTLRRFRRDDRSAIMLFHSAASLLAHRHPDALSNMARRCRIALVNGPVSGPFVKLSDAPIDLVIVDWHSVAKRIVDDLLKHQVPDPHRPVAFAATAACRVPINSYTEKF